MFASCKFIVFVKGVMDFIVLNELACMILRSLVRGNMLYDGVVDANVKLLFLFIISNYTNSGLLNNQVALIYNGRY